MKRKLKEVLLARGYTEEELKAMEPMLANPKFASAIEAEFDETVNELNATIAEREKVIKDTNEWYDTVSVPERQELITDLAEAQSQAAAHQAKLKVLEDAGLIKVAKNAGVNVDPPTPKPNEKPAFDESKYVPIETFNQAYSGVRQTVIDAADIPIMHHQLFGSYMDGGMRQLSDEYAAAVKSKTFSGTINEFWERKYKVPEQRAKIAEDKRKADEEAIRADERQKLASQYGNPNTAPMLPSRLPFTRSMARDNNGQPVASRPWERTPEQRQTERVSKFSASAAKATVQ